MSNEHELAPLYVLDALDEDETLVFVAHLATCAQCQQEVREMAGPLEALASAVAEPAPPELRASVLAAVAATEQDVVPATATTQSETSAGGLHSIDGGLADGAAPVRRRNRRPLYIALASAAAAIVLIAGIGGWGWNAHQESQELRAQQQVTAELLAAPDAVKASAPMGSGVGTVVVSQQRGQAILLMSGVAAPPAGKVYEAWTITGTPAPAGTFSTDGTDLVHLPSAALSAEQIAVTVEPEGGSAAPTSTPVFAVSLK